MNPGSKKDKKHAKENSGIAAAVSKQAAGKFSNGNTTSGNNSSANSSKSQPASNASSPPVNTPEARPVAPDHANPAASPLLDALSTTSVSASTAPSMTNDWARGALAGSPGNLISLMGESPPTQPSSLALPPNNARRPVSFHMDAHYQPQDMQSQQSAAAHRRSSMHSHARAGSNPPLPHHPQAHFYGAPGLDLNFAPQAGMKAGERGYFFGLDRLPRTPDAVHGADTVALTGYEGGLEVHAVSKRSVTPVASLKGLRGGVFHAKILPWTLGGEAESVFPLVAVVLHGPVLPQPAPTTAARPGEMEGQHDEIAPQLLIPQQDGFSGRSTPIVDSYQTSVQVYSLKTNKLVDVLLQSQPIPVNSAIPLQSPVFHPPPPSGAFTIKADGGTIAVCSGITGECWIFRHLLEHGTTQRFGCAGKVWTGLQQSFRGEMAEENDKTQSPSVAPRTNPQTPIIALNGRWIAYCPSAPSSQITLRAQIPVPLLGRSPGTSTLTPPHLPTVTSSVDLPISDSVVNKIMRETTQELIQGAKWVGQQGLQAWNSYWNRSVSPQSQQPQARSPPQQWTGARSPHPDPSHFPPTHGANVQATPKEPGLVSILDVDTLSTSTSVHPLTTFATPLGCSFLSFSPSALSLFTASSKGDVQTVWDLMRVQYTKSSPLQATLSSNDSIGPHVRQIAQFSRMTVARIVEVAWAEPQGDRLAMVTERGTIHLLDMPFSASIWPPPRRRKPTAESASEPPEAPNSAVSMASGALGAAYQAARPFVTRQRRGSASVPAVAGNTFKDSAAHGGRVIAASISNSLGKTGSAISQLRHNGENRVSLPHSTMLPASACVTWIRSRKTHALFAVGSGVVRTFPCKPRQPSAQAGPGGRRFSRSSPYKDLKLPLLPDDVLAPAIRQILDLGAQDEVLDLSDQEMDAGNTLTLNARPRAMSYDLSLEAAIPQAEIESSAPYQPFHTDRRVALCEYTKDPAAQVDGVSYLLAGISLEEKQGSKKKKKSAASEVPSPIPALDTSAWAFGQDIAVVQLDLGLPMTSSEDIGNIDDHRALPASAMERVLQVGNEEQIVVTTRRRRGARRGDAEEDGFFEDDCEVLDFADQRV
ncbi:hypothetical protein B0I35DRAFT_473251 [Stachybotrys elegans]|uniref:BCAS3 domain-containing protein n=1 Tax=Stachybotrys elegans TaxID=80388 RepID=A0A8K0WXJ5_9HYPO|nr:hypothetical protein B0I35DRAFT_473251 [Stachybotrys elegans]